MTPPEGTSISPTAPDELGCCTAALAAPCATARSPFDLILKPPGGSVTSRGSNGSCGLFLNVVVILPVYGSGSISPGSLISRPCPRDHERDREQSLARRSAQVDLRSDRATERGAARGADYVASERDVLVAETAPTAAGDVIVADAVDAKASTAARAATMTNSFFMITPPDSARKSIDVGDNPQ
jgi:hypothetical protein